MFEKQISLYQNEETAQDKYIVFHYNCWQYDFYEEPAIAIIAAIRNEIERYMEIFPKLTTELQTVFETVVDIGKDLLQNYLQNKLGFDPFKYFDKVKDGIDKAENRKAELDAASISANDYDTYYKFKGILDSTQKQLAKLAEKKPIILVVNELDRCMPDYSIKVLERLHHLFDENSKIIVILAVDKTQLHRTINQIFGSDTEKADARMSEDYLRKFINFSVSLDTGIIADSFWEKYKSVLENYDVSDDKAALYFELPQILFKGMDIRTQEHIMDHLQTLHSLVFNDVENVQLLYFEMIYNVVAYKAPSILESNEWFLSINPIFSSTTRASLGNTLIESLSELVETSIKQHNRSFENRTVISANNPLGAAFLLFTKLNDKNFDEESNYRIEMTFDGEIVKKVKAYHKLSKIIT